MVSNFLKFEDLTLDEQTAVTQLKSRMAGHMDEEMFDDLSVFVRFLRARDLNVSAAENMLKNHIEWRKANQVDTILTDYVAKEVCSKFIALSTLGIDKEGSPIMYFEVGSLDFRGLLKSCRKMDFVKYVMLFLEKNFDIMEKESYKRRKHIDKWTVIVNCENFSFGVATHKQCLELFANLILSYDANYPERLKIAYFINDGWRDEILKLIDNDVLPAFLGGTRTDPDGNPLCKSFVVHGGVVPESYFGTKKRNSLTNVPDVKNLLVTRKAKSQLTYSVTEPGSHIEWEFETKCRDIGFSLLYKKDVESETKVMIPKQRIDTNMCYETGMFKCEASGIYIIEFDNTYSWMHQKEIFYRVSVVKSSLTQ